MSQQTPDKSHRISSAELAEQTLRILAVQALMADGCSETEATTKVRLYFKVLRPTFSAPSTEQRIGFNEFLGQVQHRLIQEGYDPPLWPDTIRDQGDLESALDSCVKWCKDRLAAPSAIAPKFLAVGYVNTLKGCTSTKYEPGRLPDGERMLYIAEDK